MADKKANANFPLDPLVHLQMKDLAKEMKLTTPEIYEKAAIDFLIAHKREKYITREKINQEEKGN